MLLARERPRIAPIVDTKAGDTRVTFVPPFENGAVVLRRRQGRQQREQRYGAARHESVIVHALILLPVPRHEVCVNSGAYSRRCCHRKYALISSMMLASTAPGVSKPPSRNA